MFLYASLFNIVIFAPEREYLSFFSFLLQLIERDFHGRQFFKDKREGHVGISAVEAFFSARLPNIFLHVKVIMYRATLHTSERLKGLFL